MPFSQISQLQCLEYTDADLYRRRVGAYLALREAENAYILGELSGLVAGAANAASSRARLFTIEDGGMIQAAAMLFPSGCLACTWASFEAAAALAQALSNAGAAVTNVLGPADVASEFARCWTGITGRRHEVDRAERIYQLARVRIAVPESGRLELATAADQGFLVEWMQGFMQEAHYEVSDPAAVTSSMIANGQLYVWNNPGPVSMCASVNRMPRAVCINFVYTPPALRRLGHAAAAVSALARHMLGRGHRACVIMTDPDDFSTNRLYQKVGARTVGELLRLKFSTTHWSCS